MHWLPPASTPLPDRRLDRAVFAPLQQAVRSGALPPDAAARLGRDLDATWRAWTRWNHTGGLEDLVDFAARLSRRDRDRGAEAATATWVDVQDRLDHAVARHLRGASLPSFRTTDDVTRYHRIQVRLRLQDRWRRPRRTEPLDEDGRGPSPTPEEDAQRLQDGLAVVVGTLWFVHDKPSERHPHWWQVARHVLQLEAMVLPSHRRNDVVEARLGLLARVSICRAQAGRLRGALPPGSSSPLQLLDRPTLDPHLLARTAEVLAPMVPRLAASLESLDCTSAERGMLRRSVLGGALIRTRASKVGGTDAAARRSRLASLCTGWGTAA